MTVGSKEIRRRRKEKRKKEINRKKKKKKKGNRLFLVIRWGGAHDLNDIARGIAGTSLLLVT